MLHFSGGITLVAIEGPDGAGTSTQTQIISTCLSLAGFHVLATFDPYDIKEENKTAWIVRRLITGDIPGYTVKELGITQTELRRLYAIANWRLAKKNIIPFFDGYNVPGTILAKKRWNGFRVAITDRWNTSGQIYGPALGMDRWEVLGIYQNCYHATATGCLDVPAEVAAFRCEEREGEKDYYERSGSDFQEKIRKLYRELEPPFTHNFSIVDGTGSRKEVAVRLLSEVVFPHLEERLGYEYLGNPEELVDAALNI